VNDRGRTGGVTMSRGATAFSGFGEVPWTNPRYPFYAPSSSADPNNVIFLPQHDGKLTADGWTLDYETWQGVRTSDLTVGQWNTPDAYAGEVHDPMSQKPFMWNRSNPYAYADPSGYCAPECVAPILVAGEVAAAGAEVEGGVLTASAVLEVAGQRVAAQALRVAVARANSFTWQQFERLNGWGTKGVSQVGYVSAAGLSRVADYLNREAGVIGEAKNVQRLSNIAQMKDLTATALSKGWELVLRIRANTEMSKPFSDALNKFVSQGGKLTIEVYK
jgi:hypothetical protein